MKKFGLNLLKIIGIVLLALLIFIAIISGHLAGAMIKIAEASPDVDPNRIMSSLSQNSSILDKDDQLIEKIDTAEHREVVHYEDIPEDLVNAFICAEDKRFETHNGVDFFGILSSIRDYFTTHDMRGASTITMQLARNMYLSSDVNWTRKIQEIYLATQIEDKLSKKEIMEAYLNRIFFGQNAYGVQAAAQTYFSKDVKDLDLPQCAALASIVPAPTSYSLYLTLHPTEVTDQRVLGETMIDGERYTCVYNEPAYDRAKWVLGQMLKNGKISQEQYDQAVAVDVADSVQPISRQFQNASNNVTDLIQDQTILALMDAQNWDYKTAEHQYFYGGLTIHSTLDMDMQKKLQDAYTDLNQHLNPGALANKQAPLNLSLKYDQYGNISTPEGNLLYYKKSNLINEDGEFVLPKGQFKVGEDGSLTIMPGRIRAYDGYLDLSDFFTIDENKILHTHQVSAIPIDNSFMDRHDDGSVTLLPDFFSHNTTDFYHLTQSGNLALSTDYYSIDEKGVMQPQSAVTVLDSQTGEVRAMVGGREQDSRHFLNRALKYPRQPGSSIKPLADYTAPFALGYNQGAGIDDVPMRMSEGKPWPSNFDGKYRGYVSLSEALYQSLNPPAVRWLDKIGIDTSKEYLTRYGIINKKHPDRDHFIEKSENETVNDEILPLAIGGMTQGLTTLDMAGAYQAIANQGTRVQASCIRSIEDSQGRVLYENTYEETEVLPPQLNYQLLDVLLRLDGESYITSSIQSEGIQQGAKTGTTDDERDFWTCIVSPYYTIATWLGADNANLTMTGSSLNAARVAGAVSRIIHADKSPADFPVPEGVYKAEVCMLSGKKPTDACRSDGRGMVKSIWVSKETEPTEECDVHVYREVDRRNNLLASDNLAAELRVTRAFVETPEAYQPLNFGGVLPADWSYRVPLTHSTLPAVEAPQGGDWPIGEKRSFVNAAGEILEKTRIDEDTLEVKRILEDGTVETYSEPVPEIYKKPKEVAPDFPSFPFSTEGKEPPSQGSEQAPSGSTPGEQQLPSTQ